jgi:hypothetical protein
MQAAIIRQKYSQILDQPDSDNSSDEEQLTLHRHLQKKRNVSANSKDLNSNDATKDILGLKQRLAQSLADNKAHCKEI